MPTIFVNFAIILSFVSSWWLSLIIWVGIIIASNRATAFGLVYFLNLRPHLLIGECRWKLFSIVFCFHWAFPLCFCRLFKRETMISTSRDSAISLHFPQLNEMLPQHCLSFHAEYLKNLELNKLPHPL